MNKLINTRLPLFSAVALILGIYSCYEWYLGNFYFGLAVAILLVAFVLLCIFKRYGVRKIAIVMLISAILGCGIAGLSILRMGREVRSVTVTLTGRVCDLNVNSEDFNSVYYLEKCKLSDGTGLDGRVKIKSYGSQLQTGDWVTASGVLSSTYPIKAEVESYLIRHNITYELANVEVTAVKHGLLKPDELVRKYVYDVTYAYMPQNGSVMYALLTGDRCAMSDSVNYSFSRAGMLHLLAVSGLHVGFIVAVVCFALRRLRLPPYVECVIVVVPLAFYAYVCSFTPSVTRAIIMVVCSYVARMCRGRYDMLSAISWAAILILLTKPFYLFDVGFQLSFLSVYGIATAYTSVNRWLQRRKMNKFLRYVVNALVLSTSCVVATFFVVAMKFGEVPTFSALLNLIAIPLVSVAFVAGIVGLIPSVFHYLLVADDYLLSALVYLARAVSQWSLATVTVVAASIAVVIVVVALFAFGGFVNLNRLGKRIFYPICAILLVCSLVLSVLPKHARNQVYVCVQSDSAVVAVVSQSGEAALVLDFNEYSSVQSGVRYLKQFDITVCTLYITDCSELTEEAMDLLAGLPLGKAYILSSDDSEIAERELWKRHVTAVRQNPNSTTGNGIKVRSHFGATLSAVSVAVDGIDICVAYGSNESASQLIGEIAANAYVLPGVVTPTNGDVLTLTPYQGSVSHNYGANKYGNFTIKQKGDTIYLTFR